MRSRPRARLAPGHPHSQACSTHKNRREFTISTEGEWKANTGIPLEAQVQFNSKRVEGGVFRLEPADDLEKGEYGFYLFRGRDLPGFLYDFSVPGEK